MLFLIILRFYWQNSTNVEGLFIYFFIWENNKISVDFIGSCTLIENVRVHKRNKTSMNKIKFISLDTACWVLKRNKKMTQRKA